VLENVTFSVAPGETLGIVGRNGSGKSTLLKILAGILKPDSGSVTSRADKISLMALQLGFDNLLSGRDNAVFGGMLLGFSRQEVEAKLDQIQSFSGLGRAFYAPVKSYSSGMSSRLKFAVAINLAPDIMLLDEVLAVGDMSFRKKAAAAMHSKINSDQTTILVTHNPGEVQKLCDRAILLERGKIMAEGHPDEVIDQYQSLLEATMN